VLDGMLASAPAPAALLDGARRFVRVNRRFAVLSGRGEADHAGRTPGEVLPGALGEALAGLHGQVVAAGRPVSDVGLVGEAPADPSRTRHFVASGWPVLVRGRIEGVGIALLET
jgi:hypothetical protein